MIEQLTTSAALAVLNRMLSREVWARERLAPFAGRIARFEALVCWPRPEMARQLLRSA